MVTLSHKCPGEAGSGGRQFLRAPTAQANRILRMRAFAPLLAYSGFYWGYGVLR